MPDIRRFRHCASSHRVADMRTALLLSGGMDSIAIAHWLSPEIAITIDYGQRSAAGEIRASGAVAEALAIEHYVIHADLSVLGSGDMAGTAALRVAPVSEWWPFRNQMLVTFAAMKCVPLEAKRLLIGSLRTDRHHADGRRAFVDCLNVLLRQQEGEITLEAPAINLGAAELIRMSGVPMEMLAWAHSCHVSDFACGLCRGCRKHYETLRDLGEIPY
jgi:7-cyano-7-deazaguanine synthase